MADGRFVAKRISLSEQLGRVSWQADLLFTKCIPHLDVAGRLTGNPVLLKAQVVPLRAEIGVESIPGLINELTASVGHEGEPLVIAYEVSGQPVLYFPGFRRIQKGLRPDREAESRLPPPPQRAARRSRNSGATPEESGASPEQVPPKVKVKGSSSLREVQVQEEEEGGTAGVGGWPAVLAGIFEAHIGHVEPGEMGRFFSGAVELHGAEAVARGLTEWAKQALRTEKPQFLTPKYAARQIAAWIKRSAPVKVYDDRGEATPEFLDAVGRGR